MTIAASERTEIEVQPTVSSITQGAYTVTWVAALNAVPSKAEHAESLGQFLAQTVRTREPLRVCLEFTGEDCPPSIDERDLAVRLSSTDGQPVVHELVLPGKPHAHVVPLDLPWETALIRIARLLKAYIVERCQRDTFTSWVRELPTGVVRARLGLPQTAPESPGGAANAASSAV